MSTGWAGAEWVASYQIYGISAHTVYMQRVFKKRQAGLPPKTIRVGATALNPAGLLCTNAFGASQFSPANWDKLSRVVAFQIAGVPALPTAGTGSTRTGPRTTLPASLPVSEVQLVTEAARDRKASIAGVSMAITDQRLSRTLKGLAIYSAKNLETALEFQYVTGEPKISTPGEAAWALIGLFSPGAHQWAS
jgi:hypothetical protein